MKLNFCLLVSFLSTLAQQLNCSKLISRNARRCINTQVTRVPLVSEKGKSGVKTLIGVSTFIAGATALSRESESKYLHVFDNRRREKDIFEAVKTGDQARFKTCLSNGANLNARDENGASVMETVIKHGNHMQFAILCLLNVEKFELDNKNRTYLETAVYSNQLLIARDLIGLGVGIEDKRVLKSLIAFTCINGSDTKNQLPLIKDLYLMSERDASIIKETIEFLEEMDIDKQIIAGLNSLLNNN